MTSHATVLSDAQRVGTEHRRFLPACGADLHGAKRGLPVIMLDIGNAIIATAASLTITRSLLHLGSPAKDLPLSLKIKNIAHDFYSSISFDCYMLMLVFMFCRVERPTLDRHAHHAVRQCQTRSLQWP